MNEKLTKGQLYQLTITRDVGGGWYPGPKGASSCRSLVTRGLLVKHGQYGPYSLSPAGHVALQNAATSSVGASPSPQSQN